MKILHIITSLKKSGAEQNLYYVATEDKENHHIVVSLLPKSYYGFKLEQRNIKTFYLNLDNKINFFSELKKLYLIIKSEKPNIIQTWMYHSDIIGGFLAIIAGNKNIVWNIRSSFLNFDKLKIKSKIIYYIHLILSNFIPKFIITNSVSAISFHKFLFNKNKFVLINNGFKNPKYDNLISLSNKIFIIGHFARFDPQKNHLMILEMAEILKLQNVKYKLFLFGRNVNFSNSFFKEKIYEKNLQENIELFDEVVDVNTYYKKCDCVVSTSIYGEGFPNVLAEAMNNGVVCLSTNIGESLKIVKEKNRIFDNLSDLVSKIIELKKVKDENPSEWLVLKNQCKTHIRKNFSIKKMIKNYHFVWNKI